MINLMRAAFFSLVVLLLGGCGGGGSVEEHVSRANQFIASSKYDSAIIELKNALQQDGRSAQARWLLGKVYFESGEVLAAGKELQLALRLGWLPSDVLPLLAEALLAQGKFSEVLELDHTGLKPPASSAVLAAKALAAMGEGDKYKAESLVNKALQISPESPEALLAKARLQAIGGDLSGASVVLDGLLSSGPENGAAWELMGDVSTGLEQLDEALAAYDRAISLQPGNYGAQLKRAFLQVRLQNFEAAQVDTSKLLAVAPQHLGANYIQGLLYFLNQKYADAITALSVAEPAFLQFPQVLFFLGSAQLLEGNLDQAAVQARRFYGIAPDSIQGRKLLAIIELQQGNHKNVEELLRPVVDANGDDVEALNLLANALLRAGNTEEGIAMLTRVAELQPGSPAAQVRLGAGLLMGGKGDVAIQQLETALELNPEFQQADILLVMNHVQQQDFEAAIAAAEAYRRRNLTSTTPLNLLGKVYQEAGQVEEARETFEKVLAMDPGDPSANHSLAQMDVAEGSMEAARSRYTTVLEHHDNLLPALIQLALLDAKAGDEDSLVAHLEQAIEAHPAALEPRLVLGRYHLSKGRPEKVAPLFASLEEMQKQSPQVLQLLALSQLSSSEHADAEYTLEQLMQVAPETAKVHHMLAMAAGGSGNNTRMEQELRRALELDKNHLPSRIAMAKLTLVQGRMDEFKRLMDSLIIQAPDNYKVLLLQAADANQNGDAVAAEAFAARAYSVTPNTNTVLALGSYRKGEDAIKLYRDWVEEHSQDVSVLMVLANELQLAQRIEESRARYEQVLQLEPDVVIALNNLAWYLREENPGKALEYARRAGTLAPESADVLDTLAMVELANKAYKQARRSIEKALQLAPDNPTLRYHRAMINAASGESRVAVSELDDLLESGGEFPEKGEARELLAALGNK